MSRCRFDSQVTDRLNEPVPLPWSLAARWATVAAAVLVPLVAAAGTAVVMRFAHRAGLAEPDPFDASTWHGRPVRQRDHEAHGVRFGFPLFVVVFLGFTVLGVLVIDALLVGG